MEIKSINDTNFGKLYITKAAEAKLKEGLIHNYEFNSDGLRNALADFVDVYHSKDRHLYVYLKGKTGVVEYSINNGERYQDNSGLSFPGRFIHALSRVRSDEMQSKIRNKNRINSQL